MPMLTASAFLFSQEPRIPPQTAAGRSFADPLQCTRRTSKVDTKYYGTGAVWVAPVPLGLARGNTAARVSRESPKQ
jgi:hypothetical protein